MTRPVFMQPRPLARPSTQPQSRTRGMAALTVVMVLFFIMALVAAYTNRNLVFEQRISANSYRFARAVDASEAGLDWTLSMLNGGRVDQNCLPSVNVNDPDFRGRILADITMADPIQSGGPYEGGYTPASRFTATAAMYPACILRGGALNCICPSVNQRNPPMAVPADGIGSAFRIDFSPAINAVLTGTTVFEARGCASPGTGNTSCFVQTTADIAVDANSRTQLFAGLVRALPVPPIAALTAGQSIIANAGTLTVTNPNNGGITAMAGSSITISGGATGLFSGPAGSGTDGRVINSAPLNTLATTPQVIEDGLWFRSLFGTDLASFLALPATQQINCAAGCTSADLLPVITRFPRNPIYLNGNLTLDQAGALGTVNAPVMIIVNGNLTVTGGVQVLGFISANNVLWSGAASMEGALVTQGNFISTANATFNYRADLLETIRLRYGSFVRIPGSWKQL